jgi:tetratricopeptide (TPR) repeat protein
MAIFLHSGAIMCPWDFWRTVVLVTTGGVLGGGVYLASIYISSIESTVSSGSRKLQTGWFRVANLTTGAGGAWAGLLAMFWAHRVPLEGYPAQMLELLATSILAGYAGNRLLPAVAERLTSEFLKKSVETAKASAEHAKTSEDNVKEMAEITRRSALITESVAYLEKDSSHTVATTNQFIGKLEAELSWNPQFRQAAILLGRMYAEAKNQYDEAIAVMDRFIDAKRIHGGKGDDAVADAFWNKANFLEHQFKASGSANAELRKRAIQCLDESLKIHPSYLTMLQEDEDFDDLRRDPLAAKFRRLQELPGDHTAKADG